MWDDFGQSLHSVGFAIVLQMWGHAMLRCGRKYRLQELPKIWYHHYSWSLQNLWDKWTKARNQANQENWSYFCWTISWSTVWNSMVSDSTYVFTPLLCQDWPCGFLLLFCLIFLKFKLLLTTDGNRIFLTLIYLPTHFPFTSIFTPVWGSCIISCKF